MKRENNVNMKEKVVKKLSKNGCTNIISLFFFIFQWWGWLSDRVVVLLYSNIHASN